MNDKADFILLGASLVLFCVAFVIGTLVGRNSLQLDVYDCTVKCHMARSIQFDDKCYCEAK
jgi:hypothetical protein